VLERPTWPAAAASQLEGGETGEVGTSRDREAPERRNSTKRLQTETAGIIHTVQPFYVGCLFVSSAS
jgi:hypothetical protein